MQLYNEISYFTDTLILKNTKKHVAKHKSKFVFYENLTVGNDKICAYNLIF
jgi:hypothetical protein